MQPLSALIVTWNCAQELRANLPALLAELEPGDELVVVDNASSDATAEVVEELAPTATLVRNRENHGFALAANQAAERARGDLLVLLNPDARVAPGFGRAIRRPLGEHPQWGAWQALVTEHGGRRINTAGNEVHFTGVSWAGSNGRPVNEAGARAHEVAFASGACLAVRRAQWQAAGGFPAHYFMYCEDLDLSLRLRLYGHRVGIEPAARVDHDYAFMADPAKWRQLERNRWATILRTYPGPLLVLVAPALLATELAIAAAAVSGGWFRHKALAWRDVVRWLPRLVRERRQIQTQRTISAGEFAAGLVPSLSSPHLGAAAGSRILDIGLRAYWRCVRFALRSQV